jgi:Na+-translocating ferredoxin:NAD+ oxidoreductase subunit D
MSTGEARVSLARMEPDVPAMMRDMLIALAALLVLPVVRTGLRPLVAAGLSVAAAVACTVLFRLVRRQPLLLTEGSAAVTGLLTALLLPLNAPLWLPCAAAAFAVLAAKEPFGPFGRNPFNPAAAGIAFVTLCWPEKVFTFYDPAKPYAFLPFGPSFYQTAQSSAEVLRSGLKPETVPFDLLWGTQAGALGTTALLVIGACGLFLFACRAAKPEITLAFLAAAALGASLFPRIACSPLTSVKYELLTGSLLFFAVFLATDPVTSPRTVPGRCLYGALAGALVLLFRWFGAYEQGECFALLAANAAVPLIDEAACRIRGLGGRNR